MCPVLCLLELLLTDGWLLSTATGICIHMALGIDMSYRCEKFIDADF